MKTPRTVKEQKAAQLLRNFLWTKQIPYLYQDHHFRNINNKLFPDFILFLPEGKVLIIKIKDPHNTPFLLEIQKLGHAVLTSSSWKNISHFLSLIL